VAVGMLARGISTSALKAARQKESDPRMRDLLAIALVRAGDSSLAPQVRRLALQHPHGQLRALAVQGLSKLHDPANRDVFRQALKDRHTAIGGLEGVGKPTPTKIYTVRAMAVDALRDLGEEPPPTVTRVPLKGAPSEAQLYAVLLEDGDPASCLAAVQMLSQHPDGRPYLQAFVKNNAKSESLSKSVALARAALK
ncbi:MAG: HEAT repeat domain-containing protein, partial [Armatimonadia bacterium]